MKINNICKFYAAWFKNKLKLNKITNKIKYSLLFIGLFSVLVIGSLCYFVSRNVVISNSKVMVNNLTKQIGLNLDERINAFQENANRIIQTQTIKQLLSYPSGVSNVLHDSNYSSILLQQTSLYKYTKFSLLKSDSGNIFTYYKSTQKKYSSKEQESILEYLSTTVSQTQLSNWVDYNGEIYFVKKIINEQDYTSQGIICFAMTDIFFEFIGTSSPYLQNDHIIIANQNGVILKNQTFSLTNDIKKLLSRTGYHIYNTDIVYDNQNYLVTNLKTVENGWKFICFIPYEKLLAKFNIISSSLIVSIIVVILCSIVFTHILTKTITKNIQIAEEGLRHYEKGDFSYRNKPAHYDEIGSLILEMNYMGIKINELIEMLKKEEAQKSEAEFQTLQAQINPHFLYNTLGSLKWASFRKGEYETASNIDSVIHLLKFTIKYANQMVSVSEEINYIKNYEKIQKVQYGESFTIRYDIDENLNDCQIPGFILQPLVENSLIHGLDLSKNDGLISVRIRKKGDLITIEVEDNGFGVESMQIPQILNSEKKYNGFSSIGIRIIKDRLQNYYGDLCSFKMYSSPGNGMKITITIPNSIKQEE